MLVVIALGGNALLRRGEPMTAENQRQNVRIAAERARAGGRSSTSSSIGARQRTAGRPARAAGRRVREGRDTTRSTCSARETEGMIGYMIEQELGNLLPFERPFATLLTMVEVDPRDPAFSEPDEVHRPGVRQGRSRPPRAGEAAGRSSRTATSGAASWPRRSRSASSSCVRSSGCSSTTRS